MKFIINATAKTPLSFRDGRSDTDNATLPYIPGSAMLGGLAQAHTLLHPGKTSQFEQFFLQNVRFGNLYPASSASWTKGESSSAKQALVSSDAPVYPLPNTARSCKRFPGFRFDKSKNDTHHGVSDHLIPWLLFELSGQTYIDGLESYKVCNHDKCGENIDRFDGFYRRGFDATEYGQPTAKETLRTRTGINRATSTVQQQILYSRVVLAEDSKFWGTIEVADDVADEFLDFVEDASDASLTRIGNNRTRGFGLVTIGLDEAPVDEATEKQELAERLDQFNTTLQTKAKAAGLQPGHSFYVSLHFTADVILLDHLLRPQTVLAPTYLHRAAGLEGTEVVYSNYQTRRVMSWNNLWRLPKADDLAIAMGAVFVLGLNRLADDNLYQTLFKLQLNGLGERRAEGFGQLLIANRFHWEVQNI